jgi:hypothetical protein
MTDTVVSRSGRRVSFERFHDGGMLIIEDNDQRGTRMSALLDKEQVRLLAEAITIETDAMRASSTPSA